MNKVLEITKLAMEINELGKHQVFVDISPHVRGVSVSINEGEWISHQDNIFGSSFYYDKSDISDYNFIKNKLLEIKEKDLSGVESFKVTEKYIQDNYSTNENKVKQVRLISRDELYEEYFNLIVFLSNIEIAIKNNDIDLALSALKKKKETLKKNIGEV